MRLAKETVEAMYSEALALANEQNRTALLKRAIRGPSGSAAQSDGELGGKRSGRRFTGK